MEGAHGLALERGSGARGAGRIGVAAPEAATPSAVPGGRVAEVAPSLSAVAPRARGAEPGAKPGGETVCDSDSAKNKQAEK